MEFLPLVRILFVFPVPTFACCCLWLMQISIARHELFPRPPNSARSEAADMQQLLWPSTLREMQQTACWMFASPYAFLHLWKIMKTYVGLVVSNGRRHPQLNDRWPLSLCQYLFTKTNGKKRAKPSFPQFNSIYTMVRVSTRFSLAAGCALKSNYAQW